MANFAKKRLEQLEKKEDIINLPVATYEKEFLKALHTRKNGKWNPEYDDLEDFENIKIAILRVYLLFEEEKNFVTHNS